jgi:hypothetical protein
MSETRKIIHAASSWPIRKHTIPPLSYAINTMTTVCGAEPLDGIGADAQNFACLPGSDNIAAKATGSQSPDLYGGG